MPGGPCVLPRTFLLFFSLLTFMHELHVSGRCWLFHSDAAGACWDAMLP
jgi:hypothetical protein